MFTGDKQTDQMILIVILIICVVFIVKWWCMCNDIHSIKLILEKKHGKDMSFIQWGQVHEIDTSRGVVIKAIYDEGEFIRCHSFNSAEFPDYTIPKVDVYRICTVVGLVRKIY